MTEIANTTDIKYKRLNAPRIKAAKQSYVTRNVSMDSFHYLVTNNVCPQSGQLVLARVDRIGQHTRLELPSGRRATLFEGDEIVVSYGNRYAPDQFLAEVPLLLEECQLVASGGIAAKVITKHRKVKNATRITPLGLIADREKNIINLDNYTLPTLTNASVPPLVLAVAGSSMNGGKTTTAVNLIKGLTNAGLKVAAAKVTGTGSGLDSWKMLDACAYPVIDFTDFGFASTYKLSEKQLDFILMNQINFLSSHNVDAIVIEVADGLAQEETSTILKLKNFSKYIDAIFFAAAEAMSAHSGTQWLAEKDLPVIAVSGALTASPLSTEEARDLCTVPVLKSSDLISRDIHQWIIDNIPAVKILVT